MKTVNFKAGHRVVREGGYFRMQGRDWHVPNGALKGHVGRKILVVTHNESVYVGLNLDEYDRDLIQVEECNVKVKVEGKK